MVARVSTRRRRSGPGTVRRAAVAYCAEMVGETSEQMGVV